MNLPSTVWKKGQSGNPNGRPRGSRDRITSKFLDLLADDFEQHGKDAIERLREQDANAYLRIVAALLPRNIKVEQTIDNEFDGLTLEEMQQRYIELRRENDEQIKLLGG